MLLFTNNYNWRIWPAVLVLIAVICSTTALRAEKILNVGYHGPLPIDKIDPYQNDFTLQTLLTNNVFEPLITNIPDEPLRYRAAERVDIEEFSLTFTIREGLKWSDGAPVIARDFVSGIKRALHPTSSDRGHAQMIVGGQAWRESGGEGEIEGLKVIDDRTLKIMLTQSSKAMSNERELMIVPMPSHIPLDYEKSWASQTLVSNGPYVISAASSDEKIILERNRHYGGPLSPSIDKVVFPSGTIDTVLRAFNAGRMDLILDVPFKQLAWVGENAGDKIVRSKEYGGLFTAMDMRSAPFDDRRVRQALILATNRAAISQAAFRGAGDTLYSIANQALSQAPDIAAKLAAEPRKDALNSARALLKEAGYSDENPLKVRLGYFDIVTFRTVAYALRHDWAAAGVEVDLVCFADNFSDMMHAANVGDLDTWVYTRSVYSDEPSALLRYLSGYVDGDLFLSFYSNDEFNEVIKKAFEAEGEELLQLLAQAERMLAADAVSNPIGGYPGGALVSEKWRNAFVEEFTSAAQFVEFSNIQAD